jgi:hypothetical protein
MLEIVAVAGLAVTAAAAATAGFRVQKRWRARVDAVWTEAARLASGQFVPASGSFWRARSVRVVAVFEPGIEVVVDRYVVSNGKSSTVFTRVIAPAPGAGELDLKLRRENALTHVGKTLGLGDIQLGDAAFDTRYLVRSNQPLLVPAWIDAPVRQALLATPKEYDATLHDGEVKLQRVGVEMHAEQLVATMQAAAALAAGSLSLHRRWRELADALGGRMAPAADETFVPGQVRFDAEHEGHHVAVETDAAPERGTRVRRELGRKDAPSFEVAPGAALGDAAGGSPRADDAWRTLQPAHLRCDGATVVVTWPGYVPDVARLRAALELLGAVRSEAPGPYR